MYRPTNRARARGPEIWFRIVHAALHGQNGTPLATYREQEVEVALGPMGILEDGHVGVLTRQIEAGLPYQYAVRNVRDASGRRDRWPRNPFHTMLQAPPSPGGAFRSASVHLRSGGVTRVVTITMMTTAE